jgi:TRAP-type mannitol/chloroaromatic compound transport system permease small subunit
MTDARDPKPPEGGAAPVTERPAVDVNDQTDRLPWLKWIDRFSILLAGVGGVVTLGLMLNIVIDVIARNLYNSPLPGTLDLTQFVWMPSLVALGLGYALLRGEHVRVNLLTAPTGPRVQRIIEVVSMVFTIGTVGLFIWFSADKAAAAMALDERAVGTRWLHIWPYRWVIAVGLICLLLQACAQLLRAVTVREFKPSDEDEAVVALEAEETVFEELHLEPATVEREPGAGATTATTTTTATTARVETR